MRPLPRKPLSTLLLTGAALALGACGGGGGDDVASVVPPPPPPAGGGDTPPPAPPVQDGFGATFTAAFAADPFDESLDVVEGDAGPVQPDADAPDVPNG